MGQELLRVKTSTLSIVMPAFNEQATVIECLENLFKSLESDSNLDGFEVIVVESNSTDGTRELLQDFAKSKPISLVLQDRPQGKGFAVRTGLKQATKEIICIFDADLEYDPADMKALLIPIIEGTSTFVLGTRHSSDDMRVFVDNPLLAKIMNLAHYAFTGFFNLLYGTRLTDPFTMYKVFQRDAIRNLKFEANRFDFDWELVGKLVRLGHVPIEIPVKYDSRSFSAGKKVRLIRDPLSWVVAAIKFRFVRL